MRPKLYELLDQAALDAALAAGYVRRQVHPTEPLAILNYTETCQFARAWSDVTLACRGLIYNTETLDVVARPFPKFFNYGEPTAPTLDLDAKVVVTDKLDGSLGILYPLPSGGWAVATRGSFTSDQALHATEVFQSRYAEFATRCSELAQVAPYTFLFEIIYPANRIVCDYGDLDDLVLLGAVDIATGRSTTAGAAAGATYWPGPVVAEFPYATLAEALAADPRPGKEGLVVHAFQSNVRVKIKQADYVALHRIVTGLNARSVWEHLAAGGLMLDLLEKLPDEFHAWTSAVCHDLITRARQIEDATWADFTEVCDAVFVGDVPATVDREQRKAFAGLATKKARPGLLFALLDRKPIRDKVWAEIRPEGNITPSGREFSEDAA